jgi:beta-glucosidase
MVSMLILTFLKVMPSGLAYWGGNLTLSVQNGSVPETRLTDMATRIIASWYFLGQDAADYPARGIGMPPNVNLPHTIVDARDPADRPTILQSAIEGHVLVKNANKALPLAMPKMLSIYGYDAKAPNTNIPGPGFNAWSFGLQAADVNSVICGFSSSFRNCPVFQPIAQNGTIISGGGSGANSPAYISAPFDAITTQAIEDGTILYWDFVNANANGTVPSETDAALVFINAIASEGIDRPALRDDFSDALVNNIAAQCNNTIVVIHNAGVRLVDQFINNPNVTAVIFAHLPGQDSGRALVELLYGRQSPSGKLPYTVAKNESDYGNLLNPAGSSGQFAIFPQHDFTEGVYIDYRAFDQQDIEPRFEFGFGLTYSTFNFSDLVAAKVNTGSNATLSAYPTEAIIPGGHADLWETVATVTATVTNTGDVPAAEVAQLYVGIPRDDQPTRQLRGFEKKLLPPGESVTIEFGLRRRDLSVWDAVAQQWLLPLGEEFQIYVGSSSRDLPLSGTLTL